MEGRPYESLTAFSIKIKQSFMTTQQVANQLVEMARQGKIKEILKEMFASDAVSIEANDSMGPRTVKGLPAIIEKSKMFDSMVEEFHGAKISDPLIAGNYFSISWWIDTTMKGRGRSQMEEICVYKVENDKIVLEQFFY
jgi:TATA-binding protein-associated factor Taf7